MEPTNRHIMVVEDDKTIRDSIQFVLETEGYDVQAAQNGAEALKILRSNSTLPCLILLDVAMPVMDGFEFRNEQLKDKSLQNIPVVVITADGRASDKANSMKASGFARKPVEVSEILKIAENYC